jgi:hypothetical protein
VRKRKNQKKNFKNALAARLCITVEKPAKEAIGSTTSQNVKTKKTKLKSTIYARRE